MKAPLNNISIEKKLQKQGRTPLNLVLDSGSVESHRLDNYDEELISKFDENKGKSVSFHPELKASILKQATQKR
jgi:hypothetical protein